MPPSLLSPTRPPDICGYRGLLAPTCNPRWLKARSEAHIGLRYRDNIIVQADRWVNGNIRYQADVGDDWAPPLLTLERGYGDCEDMALLKRAIILRSGVPESCVWFVLAKDLVSRGDHAFLVALDNGTWRLLDSFNSLSQPLEQARDYTPIMAFSGMTCWLYGRKV